MHKTLNEDKLTSFIYFFLPLRTLQSVPLRWLVSLCVLPKIGQVVGRVASHVRQYIKWVLCDVPSKPDFLFVVHIANVDCSYILSKLVILFYY